MLKDRIRAVLRAVCVPIIAKANTLVMEEAPFSNTITTTPHPKPGGFYTAPNESWALGIFHVESVKYQMNGQLIVTIQDRRGCHRDVHWWHRVLPKEVEVWKEGMVLQCPWQNGVYGVVLPPNHESRNVNVALTDGHSWWVSVEFSWIDLLLWPTATLPPFPLPYLTTREPHERADVANVGYAPRHPSIREQVQARKELPEAQKIVWRKTHQFTRAPWQNKSAPLSEVTMISKWDNGGPCAYRLRTAFGDNDNFTSIYVQIDASMMEHWPWKAEDPSNAINVDELLRSMNSVTNPKWWEFQCVRLGLRKAADFDRVFGQLMAREVEDGRNGWWKEECLRIGILKAHELSRDLGRRMETMLNMKQSPDPVLAFVTEQHDEPSTSADPEDAGKKEVDKASNGEPISPST